MENQRSAAQTKRLINELALRVQGYEKGVRGLRGAVLVGGREHISLRTYLTYMQPRDIEEEFPGADGFGFIRRIAAVDETAFLAEARRDINPNFKIRQLKPHAGERDVVTLIEPSARNLSVWGLDIASDDRIRSAAVRAMQSGRAALTSPIEVDESSGAKSYDLLLLLPVCTPGLPIDSVAERESATVGWVYASLRADALLGTLTGSFPIFTLQISDVTEGRAALPFFTSGGAEALPPEFTTRHLFSTYGRQWSLDVRPTPQFLSDLHPLVPRYVFLLGASAALLVCALSTVLLILSRRRHELLRNQELLAGIVANSADSIVVESLDGLVVSWNEEAERAFGYRADEAVGHRLVDLILPADRIHEDADLLARSAEGLCIAPFDTVRLRRDGTPVDVSIAATSITGIDGRISAVAKTIRDISHRKATEQALRSSNVFLEEQVNLRSGQLQSVKRDLSTIMDALPSMIGYWDKDLILRFANRAYSTWIGVDPATLAGTHMRSLFGDEVFEHHLPDIRAALRGQSVSFDRTHPGRNPTPAHYMVHLVPDVLDGDVRGFYVLAHDVTEITDGKHKLAAVIRENEGLLNTLHRHALVSVADRQGRISEVNDGFCAISGYTRDELIGQDHCLVKSGVHPPEFWKALWQNLNAGNPWRGEICNRAKDGSLYWMDSIIAPFLGEDGQIAKYISIRFDITAHKEAQRRLIESEMFLQRVEKVSGVGGFTLEFSSNKQLWTRQTYRIHDLEEDRPPDMELLHGLSSPDVRARLHEAWRLARARGIGYDIEVPIATAKNRPIWIRMVGEVESDHGVPVRIVGAIQDITARRLAEMALRESEQRLRMVTDNIPGLISHLDRDLRYRFVNRAYATWFDVDPAKLIGMRLQEFYGDAVFAEIAGPLRAALGGTIVTDEREIVARNVVHHCHVVLIPQRDDGGEVIGLFAIHTDITQRRRAELALRASESFLARTGAMAGVGGWEIDLVHDTLTWSDETKRLHAVAPDHQPTLEEALRFYTPASRSLIEKCVRECIERAQPYDVELEVISAKGRTFWARATGAAEFENGRPVRLVGALQDITERRRMEEHLREISASADKANRAKSEFLANMSHEIRTPLNAVIGLGYLLEQTTLSDDQRQFLAKIQFAGRALLGVINNVLDLSKIEAGEMSLEDEPFDLPNLVRDLSQMLAPQAAAKGIELIVQPAIDLPRAVKGDASRLRQILTNLLSNSIKFTEAGHVTFHIFCTEHGTDSVRLRCEVEDTGIGIEEAALGRLFTPFTQADASTTRRFGGTGLGLSIARRFVELMSGEIGVTSTVGVGTTFWTEIPLRMAPTVDAGAGADCLRILLAASGGDSPQGLSAMVRALGFRPQTVESGEQLLGVLGASQPAAWPHVLIVENQLDDIGVGQLIARIKRECNRSELPPIVAIADPAQTSMQLEREHEELVRTTDVLLMRPVSSSALFNAINSAVSRRYGHERVMRSANFDELNARWLVGVSVLVVDDSDVNLEVAKRILERQGAIVTTRSDGQAALEYVRCHHRRLDIVLMDVQMPILDGNEATRCIRTELPLQTLPIVALTAGALMAERQRSIEAGMNDFISKPFEPQALIRKVRHLVEQARGEPVPLDILDDKSASQTADAPWIPSIDAGVVQQMFGDDLPLFSLSLAQVLQDYADLALPISLSPDDATTRSRLKARTHKLKGSAGMIGARRIMRLAGAAEGSLQDGRSADVVEDLLKQLASALTTLREEGDRHFARQPQHRTNAEGPVANRPSVGIADIDELCVLLESQNLAAVGKFGDLSRSLRDILDAARFDRLRAAVDDLNFPLGAELLREAIPR